MHHSIIKNITLLVLINMSQISFSHDKKELSKYVDSEGNISFPSDFQVSMTHLGSWFVPEGDANGFHGVYTEKETIEHFQKTGKFPDGATLIKELRGSTSGNYTTGTNIKYPNQNIKQWFVMIKDSKNRFNGNSAWGDGWGWALYKRNDREKNIVVNYKTECLGCHIPAKANDWIYTEAYPILH